MAAGAATRIVLSNQVVGVTAGTGTDTASQIGGGAFPTGWRQQLGRYERAQILLDAVNTVAGTNPLLDIWVQHAVLKQDGSAIWVDLGHFVQISGSTTAQQIVHLDNFRSNQTDTAVATSTLSKALAAGTFNNGAWGDDWRVAWTVGGTGGAAYTWSVVAALWGA